MTLQEKVQKIQQPRLNSWKEIASFLGHDERTVKRWEKARGLPVHRWPGGPGRVFAYCDEIDAWQRNSSRLNAADSIKPAETTPPPVPVSDSIHPETNLESHGEPQNASRFLGPTLHRPTSIRVFAGISLALLITIGVITHARRIPPRQPSAHVPPPQARDLYLSGRFYWNKRTPADLKLALRDFQAAVAVDPGYAAAYAGIADCYGLSTEFASMPPQEAYPRMLEAARRSVFLDPTLPEAHRALGFVLFYWNWDRIGSRHEFERAIELDARDATTFHWFANVLLQSQNVTTGLQMIDKARELDPSAPSILADRGLILRLNNRQLEAADLWRKLEQSDPEYLPPHWYLSQLARDQRNADLYLAELRSIASLSQSPADARELAACEQAYRRAGANGLLEADAEFHVQQARKSTTGYLMTAQVLDLAHRKDEALNFLELAYRNRDPAFPTLANPGTFTDLAGSPRFEALKARSLLPFPDGALDSRSAYPDVASSSSAIPEKIP